MGETGTPVRRGGAAGLEAGSGRPCGPTSCRWPREVFAESGFSGARIEEIAARTETSKRMIYYYFSDKEGLYRAVLEDAYTRMRLAEDALDLGEVPPVEALRQLAEFTFDHHRNNTDFIRLVMIENVHGGTHMSRFAADRGAELVGDPASGRHLPAAAAPRGCSDAA